MSKTQITGKRIKDNTIFLKHLSPDLMLSESYLNLNFPTHNHSMNKSALDKIRYTGNNPIMDLKLLDELVLEIIAARRSGNNLSGTMDMKADKAIVDMLQQEILEAGENGESISTVISNFKTEVQGQIDEHSGTVTHNQLDSMHSDYTASKNGENSLNDRLVAIESQVGSGDGTGTMTINTLNQWQTEYTIQADDDSLAIDTFTIAFDFVPNSNTIQVFEGPLLLKNGVDYIELENNQIQIISDLFIGMELTIFGTSNFSLWTWHESIELELNQSIVTLTNSYTPGSGEIIVYEDGMLLKRNVDYNEISSTEIEMIEILPEFSIIEVFRRR